MIGEINWDVANKVFTDAYSYLSLHANTKNIIIVIASPGGDPDATWAMHTTLKSFGIRVVTIGAGKVLSAATLLFLTGSKRYIFKESVFLFHEPIVINAGELGTIAHMVETIEGERIDAGLFKKVLETEIKAPPRFIRKLADPHKPTYIKAEQALRINLATHIIANLNEIKL